MGRYKKILIAILFVLFFSACAVSDHHNFSVEEMLMTDIDFLVTEIQAMYDDICPELLYDPDIYIAFTDLDFDDVPEFFYGYQTITSSHNKIWYRAHSLRDHAIIDTEHAPVWYTYIYPEDEACSFFTGPKIFMEGYYLNDNAIPCFVTKAYAGPITDPRTDYAFIEYTNSKLSVNTGFECDKELLSTKQVWTIANIHSIEDDIVDLLKEYSALS